MGAGSCSARSGCTGMVSRVSASAGAAAGAGGSPALAAAGSLPGAEAGGAAGSAGVPAGSSASSASRSKSCGSLLSWAWAPAALLRPSRAAAQPPLKRPSRWRVVEDMAGFPEVVFMFSSARSAGRARGRRPG
ncbi:hypothetical protein D0B54_15730 [Solimonas sp. K1W22B-7]|nr:hypothetical protein D0B54_15730 [Solimonas sp. K1W22B-7]